MNNEPRVSISDLPGMLPKMRRMMRPVSQPMPLLRFEANCRQVRIARHRRTAPNARPRLVSLRRADFAEIQLARARPRVLRGNYSNGVPHSYRDSFAIIPGS